MTRPIQRGNLHDEVVVLLRDLIIKGELLPGSYIPEAELCGKLGISRTPMREAIRILASQGLVTLVPRRGAVVAKPTAEELQGLFLALGGLESACAPMACANFTANEIGFIERQHELMLGHFSRGDMTDYYKANEAIHQSIANGTRNKFLIDLHQSLSLRILRVRFFIDLPKSAWARAQREHEEMLKHIKQRQGEKLARLVLDHMIGSWKDYELTFSRSKPASAFIASLPRA